jgi:hypothetical protein
MSLSLDNTTQVSTDEIEAGSDLMEVLHDLVATQSNEQWLRLSVQPVSSSHGRPSSKGKGLYYILCPSVLMADVYR